MNSNNHSGIKPPKPKGSIARPAGKSRRAAKIVLAAVAVILIAIVVVVSPYFFSGATRTAEVKIPKDATEEQIMLTLTSNFGESYAGRVMSVSNALGFSMPSRSGMYTIEKGMSPFTAGRILARGAQTEVKLTINGFRSLDTMAGRIAAKMNFSAEDFMKAATDPQMLAKHGLDPARAMALFFDDTYFVHWDDSAADVVKKMARNYDEIWNPERTRKLKKLGITPAEAVIICSITDEETNKADEKDKIARLYLNRLQKGMKLQADPTVKFALGDFSIRRVTSAMCAADSPYNTYRYKGLPPGPIRTTSTRTLDALLDSKPSEFLYMCAKEDFSGYHNFAVDFASHQENARRYQQELNRRNIR